MPARSISSVMIVDIERRNDYDKWSFHMKKVNRLILYVILGYIVIISLINLYLTRENFDNADRDYRVSINRIENGIHEYEELYGMPPSSLATLSDFTSQEYPGISAIYNINLSDSTIDEQKEFLDMDDSDYVIITTDNYYYKVTYIADNNHGAQVRLTVNVISSILFVVCLGLIIYIRQRMIKPFYRLSDVPYELSKGNLTIPVKEQKNKLFGRFVWGMDLLRENLEQNKARELELQKEKKVLLLSLSHDIKTPLSAIKLYAKALGRNLYKSEDKKQEITENISTKVDEIEGYIAEIVKASNEDFLTFEVDNQEFYIRDVLEAIREYYDDKMSLNQIDFTVGNYSNCLIIGDKDRLVEVIQNVIENAIKYGDGRKISVEAEKDDESYSINILNTGCTLSGRELPHIFDSFFRGSNVAKQQGSGLGLYICRSLMHLMDGEITAEFQNNIQNDSFERCVMCVKITLRLA